MKLQDFLDRQAALTGGPRDNTAAIAVRMQNALHQSLGALAVDDLPGIAVEAAKLKPPERAALKAAFIEFVDFHRDAIANGVVP